MQNPNILEETVRQYLKAIEERDIEQCVALYHDDAEIKFHLGHYAGRQDIERWHRDRFDADMRLVRVDSIQADGNTVVVKGAATSKKLKAWKINDLAGSMTITFQNGKIRNVTFGMRLYNPLEGW